MAKQQSQQSDSQEKSQGDADQSADQSNSFEKGDRVQWNTRQGKTTGHVEKKITSPTTIKGHTAKASEEEPQYLVRSDRTGSEAAHKPTALEPTESSD
jgi:hypothetical protein